MGAYINEDTKVYLSATYSRHSKPKRSFSLVIKGLLISTTLLGSLALGGVSAFAAGNPSIPPTIAVAQHVQANYEDEQALITNLNMAVKAIKESGWSISRLTAIMDQLDVIEQKQFDGDGFKSTEALKEAVLETERVVTSYGGDGLSTLRGQNATITDQLKRIKEKVGIPITSNFASTSPVRKKNEVKILSVDDLTPSVVIDGSTRSYPQPPVIIDGSTLVPLRSIFEDLGATVSWDGDTQTVSAEKNGISITLQIGRDTAYVSGQKKQLAVPAQLVNNSTMVPLRFVSEVFGGNVKWDDDTRTVYIEMNTSSTGQVDAQRQPANPQKPQLQKSANGILAQYGKHDYNSRNQEQYDASVEVARNALKGIDEVALGGKYEQYYEAYIKGERWSGDTRDRSPRNIGLKFAENDIGDLVKAGVNKEDIIKAYKTMAIAIQLIKGVQTPDNGWHPDSAYDEIAAPIKGATCYSDAQVFSLVFDIMGFNTAIIAGNDHADMIVHLGGSWFKVGSGSFSLRDVSQALKEGVIVAASPTYGSAKF